jgi:hypothetical protein
VEIEGWAMYNWREASATLPASTVVTKYFSWRKV